MWVSECILTVKSSTQGEGHRVQFFCSVAVSHGTVVLFRFPPRFWMGHTQTQDACKYSNLEAIQARVGGCKAVCIWTWPDMDLWVSPGLKGIRWLLQGPTVMRLVCCYLWDRQRKGEGVVMFNSSWYLHPPPPSFTLPLHAFLKVQMHNMFNEAN